MHLSIYPGTWPACRPVGLGLHIFGLITVLLQLVIIYFCCWGELESLRGQRVGNVSAYYLCMQFSGYVEMKVSQAYNWSKSWLHS